MGARAFLLVVLSLGLAVLTGCADGNGGSHLPRSSPSYMGSNDPAVLDTTMTTQFLYSQILEDINQATGGGPAVSPLGGMSSSGSAQVEGGDGGSYTYDGSSSINWDDTWYTSTVIQSLSFDNFADSRGVFISFYEGAGGAPTAVRLSEQGASPLADSRGIFYEYLQAGRGSLYRRSSSRETSDGNPDHNTPDSLQMNGVPGGVELVGWPLTEQYSSYSNYNAYYTSQGYSSVGIQEWQKRRHQSGFISASMSADYHSALNVWSFDDTLSADYAVSHYYSYSYFYSIPTTFVYDYTFALLDFGRRHAQALSTATLTSSGTYCGEGLFYEPQVRDPYLHGCATFDISLTWDHAAQYYNDCRNDPNPIECYGWPVDGLITLQAGGATASYAFTPGGGTFTFDAGDGSAVFQTPLTPLIY